MHYLRWAPFSSPARLSIASKLCRGTQWNNRSHWAYANTLPMFSNPTRICRNSSNLRHKTLKVFSSQEEGNGETAPDAAGSPLSGLAEEKIDILLEAKENHALLKELESAMQKVNNSRQELDDIDKQEKDAAKLRAYIQRLEGTDSMIADCLMEVSEAEAKLRKAELGLVTAKAGSSTWDLSNKWEELEIDENAERMESIKALFVSALIGTFASIPIVLFQAKSIQGLFIREVIIFVSCALFGVTYRYTVRRNLDNIHLKTGTVAAFGIIRGLSQFEAKLSDDFDANVILSHALDAAFMVGEGILVFIYAAIALDYCMKVDLLSPFPSKKKMISRG